MGVLCGGMTASKPYGFYGQPPLDLVDVPEGARQFSPLVPGAGALDLVEPGSLQGFAMFAAPGTIERRHDLAAMLLALAPDAPFTVLAPKDMGGSRLAKELEAFGCDVSDAPKRHHRICKGLRPSTLVDVKAALAEGAPRRLDDLGLWSQPGIFSWNRIDPGTALLLDALPALAGRGADLGCGIGLLAHGVLASPKVVRLDLIDIDRRAVEAAKRNVDDPRVGFAWGDARTAGSFEKLDFVVMNPPFHAAGAEDKSLGQAFIRRAADILRTGGRLWLTANRHLPYEAVLKPLFKTRRISHRGRGFQGLRGGEVTASGAAPGAVRLDKLLANLGYGSRREVRAIVRAGRVVLAGAPVADADRKISLVEAPALLVDGAPLDPLPGLVVMMNKPAGVTCSRDEAGRLAHDLLPERWRRRDPPLSTIGRLDKDTTGLLLLTDDGAPPASGHRAEVASAEALSGASRASLARR